MVRIIKRWVLPVSVLLIILAGIIIVKMSEKLFLEDQDLPSDFSTIPVPAISLYDFEKPKSYIRDDSEFEGYFVGGLSMGNCIHRFTNAWNQTRKWYITQTGFELNENGEKVRIQLSSIYVKTLIWQRRESVVTVFGNSLRIDDSQSSQRRKIAHEQIGDSRFNELVIANPEPNQIYVLARVNREYFLIHYKGDKTVNDCVEAVAVAMNR